MKTDEFVDALAQKYRIYVDRKTVFNYAKQGLITGPKIINRGRGGGKISVYSEQSFAEFVTAYIFIKRYHMSRETVITARNSALNEYDFGDDEIGRLTAKIWNNFVEGVMK